MINPWPDSPGLHRSAAAVLAALHLGDPRREALATLTDKEWQEALGYCDRSRITLALRDACRDAMPEWVRERTDANARSNVIRLQAIEEIYRGVTERLGAAGIEFLALKGLTHAALFGARRESRVQYDIDLYVPPGSVYSARDVLRGWGYEPIEGMDRFPTDHLPAMVREKSWEWRGDYFDLAIPTPIELHFRFWNDQLERLRAPGTDEFWTRRCIRPVAGIDLAVLQPPDALAYAALHLLRHLLQGSINPSHVHEVATILDSYSDRDAFWEAWRAHHRPQLRRLQTVAFRLASDWFGCRLAPAIQEELGQLPAATKVWFADFATSPARSVFHPNKDELWLHLSLLDSSRDALRVAWRRLLPSNLPPRVGSGNVSEDQRTFARRLSLWTGYASRVASRTYHHAVSLPETVASGAHWWWRTNSLGAQFWMFLAAAVVFNFGLFIFALLYNLFLLDLGYREQFLGIVNGAFRIGGVAGTLPAAFLAYRYGLRNTLVGTIAATSLIEVLRAVIGAQLPLAALAFASGCIFSVWAVILTPIIAGAVEQSRRPTAYSIFFAAMFANGIVANWLGGRLPLWLHGKQIVLLLSALLAAFAVLPAIRLRLAPPVLDDARIYPRSRFLVLYLVPFALWHLATGAFNPFNNVYFARLGFAVQQIGSIFSGSQVVQVGAVLLAPMVIRRAGLLPGIVWMMAATALALGGLATQAPGAAAIAAYFLYMAFQWMSEPGLNTLLMDRVAERERSGASALNYLVAFSAQALASFGSGALLAQYGYGEVLAAAAGLAGVAALLFLLLLR